VVLLRFLAQERRTLEHFLPGLDASLATMSLSQLESPDTQAIAAFREAGGVGLLIPDAHRGRGAGPVEAIRVQRAIGSRAPSLAVATTMHHFSAATMLELWRLQHGLGWMLLQAIGEGKLLLASGFAEGIRGQGVLAPTMRGRRVDGGVVITGTKKPCSLSRSMDLLTASVVVSSESDSRPDELAVALVPADAPGVEVQPFWAAPVLAGAESDAVHLNDVKIESDLLVPIGDADAADLDRVEIAGFLWFVLLITASYLGMASALVEQMLLESRGEEAPRLSAAMELEVSMTSLEGVALRLAADGASADLLVTALLCRYGAQDAISRAVACAVEQLGGMAFIRGADVSYLASASRALAFHPPARAKNARSLVDALGGSPLTIT
jgi:alkylation response protein AidB-like acyl-CoA dehydrogenase